MIKQKNEELLDRIDLGVRRGVAKALADHKRNGRPIYVWRDGQIVEISAEAIPTQDEKQDRTELAMT
jgi:hypothetical protein